MHAVLSHMPDAQQERKAAQLQVDVAGGTMRGARQIESPNFDARPVGMDVDLIVVHGISLPPGDFGGPWIERLFTNCLPPDAHPYFAEIGPMRVSSHLVIARDGALTQYVKFPDRGMACGKVLLRGANRL